MARLVEWNNIASRFSRPLVSRFAEEMRALLDESVKRVEMNAISLTSSLESELSALRKRVAALEALEKKSGDQPSNQAIHIPLPAIQLRSAAEPFMRYSTCSAADLFHPRCTEIGALFNRPAIFHRKFWEWVFIINCMILNDIGQSKTALGFGVGAEPIPAVLAKLGAQVVATDAPDEIGVENGWTKNNEFANSAEALRFEGILDKDVFMRRVRFRTADMNNIADDLRDFDFCWSSCCLEHLGSLQRGIDFIINSVEKTLKIGGVACHTTEFNLSSNDATVKSGATVLYRKRDLDALVVLLRERGHQVGDIVVAPDAHYLDGYVDLPPYKSRPHLKLQLSGYAATSVGLIVRRGR